MDVDKNTDPSFSPVSSGVGTAGPCPRVYPHRDEPADMSPTGAPLARSDMECNLDVVDDMSDASWLVVDDPLGIRVNGDLLKSSCVTDFDGTELGTYNVVKELNVVELSNVNNAITSTKAQEPQDDDDDALGDPRRHPRLSYVGPDPCMQEVSLDTFRGRWMDTLSNVISVDDQLLCKMRRPKRRNKDIILRIRFDHLRSCWFCGNGELVGYHVETLSWRTLDGRSSIWRRPDESEYDEHFA
eukprot:GEMP01042303.1.p1 GENE.GEMP01042303.1~~GEMP01042303.1.p1  ORF type:complete len:242 (+),score=53.95 GEMP01042303.1:83-808(+)